jgi:hypothetical protein
MRFPRFALSIFVLPLALAALTACNDNDDVTGTGGALAQLAVDAPDTIHSGVAFDAGATATAVGVTNVQNGVVTVTLSSPIEVTGVDAEAGTTATFTNGAGATVTWTLNTLDSNTQSNVTIHAIATLPAGAPQASLTIQGSMTADGITSGELVAADNLVLAP